MGASRLQKRNVIDRLYKDFKDYQLEKGTTHNFYTRNVVGAIKPIVIRKVFKRWDRAVLATFKQYPDMFTHDEPASAPVVKEIPKPVVSGLDALKAMKAEKVEDDDGKDI